MSRSYYHNAGERPFVLPCSIFGGTSPKTGMGVGQRHRWSEGAGKGHCEFCGNYLEDVLSRPSPAPAGDSNNTGETAP